jgi:hypothetical protein
MITPSPLSNEVDYDMYADFDMVVASQGTNRADDAHISLYVLPSVSGFPYGASDLDPPMNTYVGAFQFPGGETASRRSVIRGVILPPASFHVLVINNTGSTLASASNFLSYTRYNVETN